MISRASTIARIRHRRNGGTAVPFATPERLRTSEGARGEEGGGRGERQAREKGRRDEIGGDGCLAVARQSVLAEIENRAEINGGTVLSRMPNICLASDTPENFHGAHETLPLPRRSPPGVGFEGGGGPLNHFLREKWNFRQDTIRRGAVAVADAKRLYSSALRLFVRPLLPLRGPFAAETRRRRGCLLPPR